jgi:glutathione synthase
MKLLFVADPLEGFKTYKDSTYAMMREAAGRGHAILTCEPRQLQWERGQRVTARMRHIELTADPHDWFGELDTPVMALADVDAVLMRKDPPFDSEYFYATHLLQQAERTRQRRCATTPKSSRSSSSRSSSGPRSSPVTRRP